MPKIKKPASAKATARRGRIRVVKKIKLRKKPVKARRILVKKIKAKKTKPRRIIKKRISKKIIRKVIRRHPTSLKLRGVKPRVSKKHHELLAPTEALFKAKIKVIGIGGGGGSIVSEIGRSLEKATFVIADTDVRALKKRPGIKDFWFGESLTRGLGTGVNVELAKQAAESAKERLAPIFKDQDIVIFVASLGGGLGSGATQVFAEAAREFGGITFGIFTMPFRFEGKNKQRIAQNALKILKQSLNVSLVIPNEKIFKVIDESTPITSAFSTVNKTLIESLESLIDLIYNPGVINIDFADLRTILRGVGNTAFLNTVEESGKDRVEKTCEKILKNPLLQNSSFAAQKILFNIAGAEELSMFEVEKISSHIANSNSKAKIIFGISKNTKLKNKIKTTILMTGVPDGQKEEPDKSAERILTGPSQSRPKASLVGEVHKKIIKPVVKLKKKTLAKKKTSATRPVSFVPVFENPLGSVPVLEQKRLEVFQAVSPDDSPAKKTIRRSGLEIKRAEELQEKKKIAQEKEWEIPAFLRKVKFNNK